MAALPDTSIYANPAYLWPYLEPYVTLKDFKKRLEVVVTHTAPEQLKNIFADTTHCGITLIQGAVNKGLLDVATALIDLKIRNHIKDDDALKETYSIVRYSFITAPKEFFRGSLLSFSKKLWEYVKEDIRAIEDRNADFYPQALARAGGLFLFFSLTLEPSDLIEEMIRSFPKLMIYLAMTNRFITPEGNVIEIATKLQKTELIEALTNFISNQNHSFSALESYSHTLRLRSEFKHKTNTLSLFSQNPYIFENLYRSFFCEIRPFDGDADPKPEETMLLAEGLTLYENQYRKIFEIYRLANLDTELIHLERNLRSVHTLKSTLIASFKRRIKQRLEQNEILLEAINEITNQASRLSIDLKQKHEELTQVNAELKSEERTEKLLLAPLTQQHEKAKISHAKARAEIESEHLPLKEDVAQLQKEALEITQELTHIQDHIRKKRESIRIAINTLQSAIQALKHNIQTAETTLEGQIKHLALIEKPAASDSTISERTQEAESLQLQISALENELSEKLSTLNELNATIKAEKEKKGCFLIHLLENGNRALGDTSLPQEKRQLSAPHPAFLAWKKKMEESPRVKLSPGPDGSTPN